MFAEDEDLDPEVHNCETCPVADALAELHEDAANEAAWRLFHQVVNRFTVDTGIVPLMLERLTAERDRDGFADLMALFRVFYDAVCPEPETTDANDGET